MLGTFIGDLYNLPGDGDRRHQASLQGEGSLSTATEKSSVPTSFNSASIGNQGNIFPDYLKQ